MTPKTVLAILIVFSASFLVGCGDDSSGITPNDPVVIDTVPPAVPAHVSLIVGVQHVTVTWDENAEPDLAGYVLERSFDDGRTWNAINTELLTTASFNDERFETAAYRVAATDLSENYSAFSGKVAYQTPRPKPSGPGKPVEPEF